MESLLLLLAFPALPPVVFSLPPESVCKIRYDAAYRDLSEWQRLHDAMGGFALEQRKAEAKRIADYHWATWWVTWPQASARDRWWWANRLEELR